MKVFNFILGSFSALVLMTACGEGFQANLVGASLQDRETPPAQDEQVLAEVQQDFLGLDASSSAELMSDLRNGAFEIEVDVDSSRSGDSLRQIKANIQGFDCNRSVIIRNSNLSYQELRSQVRKNLGREGQYEVEAKCQNAVCSEVTAFVRRFDENGNATALVAYAMAAADKQLKANGTGFIQKYVVQPVNLNGFGMTGTLAEKQARCQATPFGFTNDPVNQTATGSGDAFNPTGGGNFSASEQTDVFGQTEFVPPFVSGQSNVPF